MNGEARLILRDMGLRLWEGGYTQGAAAVELYGGHLENAAELLREGAEILEELGERATRSTSLAELAEILVDLGRYDEAARCADEARRTGDELDNATQAEWRMAKARLLAIRGDAEEAGRLARESVALMEQSDFIEYHANRLVGAAKVFMGIGRPDDARTSLAKAEELYAAKAVPTLVERVRSLRTEWAL